MPMTAPYNIRMLNGRFSTMGNVGYGARSISNTAAYDQYWPLDKLQGTNPLLTRSGQKIMEALVTDRSAKLMHKIVKETLWQTKSIAQALKGRTKEQTLYNVWEYFAKNYQYKEDNQNEEELRTPLRSYADRKTGVDCDCFAISVSSILTNLGIPHAIRRAKYDDSIDFTHVYVVVPMGGSLRKRSGYVVIDPVIHQFNYEWPDNQTPRRYKDTGMSAMSGLSGILSEAFDMMGVIKQGPQVIGDENKEYSTPVAPTPIREILNRLNDENINTTTGRNSVGVPQVENKISSFQLPKFVKDNPLRAAIIGTVSAVSLYYLFNNDLESSSTDKKMSGPANKKKSGGETGTKKPKIKHLTVTI